MDTSLQPENLFLSAARVGFRGVKIERMKILYELKNLDMENLPRLEKDSVCFAIKGFWDCIKK